MYEDQMIVKYVENVIAGYLSSCLHTCIFTILIHVGLTVIYVT
jgi:hypothetical protein